MQFRECERAAAYELAAVASRVLEIPRRASALFHLSIGGIIESAEHHECLRFEIDSISAQLRAERVRPKKRADAQDYWRQVAMVHDGICRVMDQKHATRRAA